MNWELGSPIGLFLFIVLHCGYVRREECSSSRPLRYFIEYCKFLKCVKIYIIEQLVCLKVYDN